MFSNKALALRLPCLQELDYPQYDPFAVELAAGCNSRELFQSGLLGEEDQQLPNLPRWNPDEKPAIAAQDRAVPPASPRP